MLDSVYVLWRNHTRGDAGRELEVAIKAYYFIFVSCCTIMLGKHLCVLTVGIDSILLKTNYCKVYTMAEMPWDVTTILL